MTTVITDNLEGSIIFVTYSFYGDDVQETLDTLTRQCFTN